MLLGSLKKKLIATQHSRWTKKLRSLEADAILDVGLSATNKKAIIDGLREVSKCLQ